LALSGLSFSISAAVGFIVLSGVTVLNGLVVMTSIGQRIESGMAVDEAVADGMMERVRAVLITGIVPAIGFVPMAIATGRGAEVQKPLAIVVIAGLIVATLLTMFVLPAISHLLLRIRRGRHVPGEYQARTSSADLCLRNERPNHDGIEIRPEVDRAARDIVDRPRAESRFDGRVRDCRHDRRFQCAARQRAGQRGRQPGLRHKPARAQSWSGVEEGAARVSGVLLLVFAAGVLLDTVRRFIGGSDPLGR